MRPFILASSSPRRKSLLSEAGLTFEVHVPDVTEAEAGRFPPRKLCAHNAEIKAREIAKRHPGRLVVGADTIVVLGDEVFGKPGNLSAARGMLERLAGKTHEVLTAVCVTQRAEEDLHIQFVETTRVRFRPLQEIDLNAYLSRIDPLDKAGAYAAQEDEGALIAEIQGCQQNVIGLPVPRLLEVLRQLD
jgi:septum formation protein